MSVSYTTGTPTAEGGFALLAPGEYPFVIVDAEEKTSKAGNAMIEIAARHALPDGSQGRKVYDNLVFLETCFWKIDQFLAAVGKHPGEGKQITLDAVDCVGLTFRAVVNIETGANGKERNVIEAYVFEEDGIPF